MNKMPQELPFNKIRTILVITTGYLWCIYYLLSLYITIYSKTRYKSDVVFSNTDGSNNTSNQSYRTGKYFLPRQNTGRLAIV